MRRREFLAALASAFASAASAQQIERLRRIGVLIGWLDGPETRNNLAAFIEELARLGWTDGRNAKIETLWMNADISRGSGLAKQLTSSQPDVLLSATTPATAALQQATGTIPIVMAAVSDPEGAGFVANFAHPNGNITGFTNMEAATSHGKMFDLLKQIAPDIKRGGIIFNPDTAPGSGRFYLDSFEIAARSLGTEPMVFPVRSDAEVKLATDALGRERGGLVVMSDSFFTGKHLSVVASASLESKVPGIYQDAAFPKEGGLMSYGPDVADVFRHAAGYVDRILRGEKPADLPVQAPTKYILAVNLKVAQALGLTVPPALLAGADELIE